MPVLWRRIVIFIVSLLPLAYLIYKGTQNQLGADPEKAVVLFFGNWAFYFLLITLSISPLKKMAKQSWVSVHRRMLGLFTLFYALLHVLAYFVFILELDIASFGSEVVKRPYILFSLPAVILLILLGVTSTQGMMRWLGKKWVILHKSIYLIAILAWLHVLLQVRSSYEDAFTFGILTALLLGVRVYWRYGKKAKRKVSA